jgi:hypothetical protein
LITPPARPAAASSSRQPFWPMTVVMICDRWKLENRIRAA